MVKRYEVAVLTRHGWGFHIFYSLAALNAFRKEYKPDSVPNTVLPF